MKIAANTWNTANITSIMNGECTIIMTVANYGMTVAVPLVEAHHLHLRVAVALPPDAIADIDGVIDEGVAADVHFEVHEEGRQLIKRRPFSYSIRKCFNRNSFFL
ncbi:hypothetical protein [Brevibacillus sp. Leaf182]|uniref:hypothetical protein n=1 Tax=Brevibacillus sp. Leaf182 TaxID=1736290 RepID=UPI0009EAD173|nr:hypothetical protein [Brevibacillus sp. Leaf182]RAT95295.1 hypothetical protein ASG16_023515 [Brevibacillus sp. Leaf182]